MTEEAPTVAAEEAGPKKAAAKKAVETVRKDMPTKQEAAEAAAERINRNPNADKPKSVTDMGDGTQRKDY